MKKILTVVGALIVIFALTFFLIYFINEHSSYPGRKPDPDDIVLLKVMTV